MSQFEHLKRRLDNWARWLEDRNNGATGYPRKAAFLPTQSSGASTDMIPVDDLDACKINEAITALRTINFGYWLAIICTYIGDPDKPSHKRRRMTQAQIALKVGCTDRTIRNRQAEALGLLEAQLDRRESAKK